MLFRSDVWGDAACEYRIVEPIVEDVEKDALWTVNREYYLSLLDEARLRNVKILLKNMCRNVGGHLIRGVCSDAAEAVAWVDALNTEAGEARFGFCVDMGVCNVCGQDLNEYITPLGNNTSYYSVRILHNKFLHSHLSNISPQGYPPILH